MDVTTSAWSETTRRISEPSTLQGTLGSLDKAEDHSSSIFSGFAALLAILLVVAVICVLWCCGKRKKRQVPYLRVTIMPLLTLPRPRQRAKNIYDLLPRRQEELGRHPSRSIRIVSTESLLSRNSDSPSSEHVVRVKRNGSPFGRNDVSLAEELKCKSPRCCFLFHYKRHPRPY